jgi:hypothetical protein
VLQVVAGIVVGAAVAWVAMRELERAITPRATPPATSAATPAGSTAHITATLFYASEDGLALVPFRREVPLADGVVAQGRQIITAQLEPPPAPYQSPIPAGTTLRAFYMTERGDAFIDVSSQISRNHPGGSTTELLTVYAMVNAVTANLPAVQRVQILVDGREVDTIAGHVDVRRPLQRDASLVKQ